MLDKTRVCSPIPSAALHDLGYQDVSTENSASGNGLAKIRGGQSRACLKNFREGTNGRSFSFVRSLQTYADLCEWVQAVNPPQMLACILVSHIRRTVMTSKVFISEWQGRRESLIPLASMQE